uniref:Prohibitin-1 isoform X1 n=1 Tax=Rhizophora mucronata TaxID=61149 RepID=A0A2P2L4L2_RHIMU
MLGSEHCPLQTKVTSLKSAYSTDLAFNRLFREVVFEAQKNKNPLLKTIHYQMINE